MALTVTLADGIRIASGAFMGVLGLVLLRLGRRRNVATATGVGAILCGAAIVGVLSNFESDAGWPYLVAGISATLGPLLCIVGIVLLMRDAAGPSWVRYGAAAAAIALGAGIGATWVHPAPDTMALYARVPLGPAVLWTSTFVTNAFAGLALVLAILWARKGIPGVDESQAAILAAAVTAWPFVYVTNISGTWSLNVGSGLTVLENLGWTLSTVLPTIVASIAVVLWSRRRNGAWFSIGLPVLTGVLVIGDVLVHDAGSVGVARLFGVALLAHVLFRADALQLGLRPKTMRRGAAASLFMAVLLIVAQVAQNFLSAQYGLVMGGVVAGAFLFAAQPIQRVIEASRAPASASSPTSGAVSADRTASYRTAARYALRDGTVTRAEETHLSELAQHLGIGAADAMRIRHEVEDEPR